MTPTKRFAALFAILFGLGVAACGDTWSGIKEDTSENLESTGEALEDAGEAVSN